MHTFLEQGFCNANITSGLLSNYSWPETMAGSIQFLPCELGPLIPSGMARRSCNPDTLQWDPVSLDECFSSKYIDWYYCNSKLHSYLPSAY